MTVEHLYCTRCETNPTVAKINGRAQLVCHCTHEDGPLSPFPICEFRITPMEWEFRTNQQPTTPE